MARLANSSSRASIAIVGFPGCSAWISTGMIELFAIANVALSYLPKKLKRTAKVQRFDYSVVARSAAAVRASHGVRIDVQPVRRHYDVVFVPPVWAESLEAVECRGESLRSHAALLALLASRTRFLASACSGALLLAHAGLLDGREATTCWWLAESLQRRFPKIRMRADELVVRDGGCWTAAAGSAYLHLGLELVNVLAGEHVAAGTARLLLTERRRGSQSPFMTREPPSAGLNDPDVLRAMRFLDRHLGEPMTISDACRQLAISERTLTRKFKASLDMPPLAYLQSRRIALAKRQLESSTLPLQRIVEQCGYEDIASFRKLFARHVGMTPREFRTRFARNAQARRSE